MVLLITAIHYFVRVLTLLLLARAVCSWFVRSNHGTAASIYRVLSVVTEPIVAPCRLITSRLNTGMLDLSVLLAFFLVQIVGSMLIRILIMIAKIM